MSKVWTREGEKNLKHSLLLCPEFIHSGSKEVTTGPGLKKAINTATELKLCVHLGVLFLSH